MLPNGESLSGQGGELSGGLDNCQQEKRAIISLPTFCLTHEGTSSKLLSLAVISGEQNKPLALHVYFCLWERSEERRSPIGQVSVRLPQVLLGVFRYNHKTFV